MRAVIIVATVLMITTNVFAEEESISSGWFRFDHDELGFQMWAGAVHDLPGPIDFASNVYLFPQKTTCGGLRCYTSVYGEVDAGLYFQTGPFIFIPMSGIGIDWEVGQLVTVVTPQLYAYLDISDLYVEWWSNIAWNSWFISGADDVWYNRLFVLYSIISELSVGPQSEIRYTINDNDVSYLPIGGHINLSYGEMNTLGLFYGYDVIANGSPLTGRITFVRYW